jgi:hypothetical protein
MSTAFINEYKTESSSSQFEPLVGLHRLPDPIYNEDGITLYCADCTRVLPLLEEGLVYLTDQPYGTGWVRGGGDVSSI